MSSPSACDKLVRRRPIVGGTQLAENAKATVMELGVGRLEVHHEAFVHLPEPHEQARGDRIQRDLGSRPGLQSGGSRQQFRPCIKVDVVIRMRILGQGGTCHQSRHCTASRGFLHTAKHPWRRSTSCYSKDRVSVIDLMGGEFVSCAGRIVLSCLGRSSQRRIATGNDADDRRGIGVERRGALGGVKDAETSACAGTEIEEPSAVGDTRHQVIGRSTSPIRLRA